MSDDKSRPEYTDADLDYIYESASVTIKAELDRRTVEVLAQRGLENVRRESKTWLSVRRPVTRALLSEAEQREEESEIGH